MRQPWVYMCSPSRSPLPPPSPPDPSRSSQCTRSERLSNASNLGWFLYGANNTPGLPLTAGYPQLQKIRDDSEVTEREQQEKRDDLIRLFLLIDPGPLCRPGQLKPATPPHIQDPTSSNALKLLPPFQYSQLFQQPKNKRKSS